MTGKENCYIANAIESRKHCGNYTYGNKCIELLENKYKFKHVFLTPSCTSAMEMGAILSNIRPGDEVILPSYTFTSTANSVVLRGAKPVFCDIDPSTMNIDVEKIESLITDRTRMIVPIDYAGIPCEIEAINSIAKKYSLIVMQDAAQSLHSFHKNGAACGSVPTFSAFSFHETKNISCGEGGALIVNDDSFVERANYVQEKGTDRSKVLKGVKDKYGWVDVGSSFLLSDILAAMLLSQLESAEEIVKKRTKVTEVYNKIFKPYVDEGALKIAKPSKSVVLNHHAFFVIFDSETNQQKFLSLLKEKHIYAYIGYVPLHSSEFGLKLGNKPEDCPLTEDIGKRIVRLPFYTELAEYGLDYCAESMEIILRQIYSI